MKKKSKKFFKFHWKVINKCFRACFSDFKSYVILFIAQILAKIIDFKCDDIRATYSRKIQNVCCKKNPLDVNLVFFLNSPDQGLSNLYL